MTDDEFSCSFPDHLHRKDVVVYRLKLCLPDIVNGRLWSHRFRPSAAPRLVTAATIGSHDWQPLGPNRLARYGPSWLRCRLEVPVSLPRHFREELSWLARRHVDGVAESHRVVRSTLEGQLYVPDCHMFPDEGAAARLPFKSYTGSLR